MLAVSNDSPQILHNFVVIDTKDAIISALLNAMSGANGNSHLALSLNEALYTIFSTSNPSFRRGRAVAVVVSDGFSSETEATVASASLALQRKGVRVLALGSQVRGDAGVRILEAITENDSDIFYTSMASGNGDEISRSLASAIACPASTTSTTTAPLVCMPSSGWCTCSSHCAQCLISGQSSQCTVCALGTSLYNGLCVASCPQGFTATTLASGASTCSFNTRSLDVAFLVDSSGSVSPAMFSAMKQFVSNVVAMLPVGSSDSR